jgi:hypothetical protein
MEKLIKGILTKKKSNNTYYTEDWDKCTLPCLPHEKVDSRMVPKKETSGRTHALKPVNRRLNKVRHVQKVSAVDDEADAEQWKVMGTATNYEKEYLRLTCAPDPSTVRPESVLQAALDYFKEKWKRDEIDYIYFLDQLRSIR